MSNQWDSISLRNINKLTKVGQESFIACSQSVSFKTPVDTGLLANNWFTEINGVSTKTTDEPDKTKSLKAEAARQKALTINIGDSISYVNNLPYVIPIEYDGHSKKAESGMVRITVAQWPTMVAKIVKAHKDDK